MAQLMRTLIFIYFLSLGESSKSFMFPFRKLMYFLYSVLLHEKEEILTFDFLGAFLTLSRAFCLQITKEGSVVRVSMVVVVNGWISKLQFIFSAIYFFLRYYYKLTRHFLRQIELVIIDGPKEGLFRKPKIQISLFQGHEIRLSLIFCKMEILRYEKKLIWPFSSQNRLALLFGPSLPPRDVPFFVEIDILAFRILVLKLILESTAPYANHFKQNLLINQDNTIKLDPISLESASFQSKSFAMLQSWNEEAFTPIFKNSSPFFTSNYNNALAFKPRILSTCLQNIFSVQFSRKGVFIQSPQVQHITYFFPNSLFQAFLGLPPDDRYFLQHSMALLVDFFGYNAWTTTAQWPRNSSKAAYIPETPRRTITTEPAREGCEIGRGEVIHMTHNKMAGNI